MEKNDIPTIIRECAYDNGFNAIEYQGKAEGAEVYSVGCVDEDGEPMPTGMPTLLLLKSDKIEMMNGFESLHFLLEHFPRH